MSAPGPATTVTAVVAEELAAAGIRRAFGVPGGEVLGLLHELRDRGVDFVLCRHESAAGMAASAYGRLTGAPGLVISTLGPGACNLLLPVANSQLDREPLICISGDLPAAYPSSHTHQRLPLLETFRPIANYAAALKPAGARATVRSALRAAGGPPAGAAFLTLSADDGGATAVPGEDDRPEVEHGGRSPEEAATLITARLAAADGPLVIVGHELPRATAGSVQRWLRGWQLPFAVTPKAKGLVDEQDERFVGVLDGAGLLGVMREAVAASDLVLGLGLDQVELIQPWHATAPVLWAREPGGTDARAEGAEVVVTRLDPLLETLEGTEPPRRWEDRFEATREARERAAGAPGSPAWIPRALASVLPEHAIVTTDVGSHKCLLSQYLPTPTSGLFLTSNGLSAIGYGLPAAIGAKLAAPERPVVAVVGDGGFAMTSQELETAVRVRAPITVVVLVDGSLSLIRALAAQRGMPPYGVDFGTVDIPKVAEAYGARATVAGTPAELRTAVEDALEAASPTVIAVPVPAESYLVIL